MALYVSALTASVILQAPGDGLERVVNRHGGIPVWSFHFQVFLEVGFAQLPGTMT